MKTNILFLSLVVLGCSSTVQNLPEESEGGSAGTAGIGGNSTAGNSSGGSSAGTGGNETGGIGGIAGNSSSGGTGGVCTPITCVTFGVQNDGEACGFVDDGCGNFIDCGTTCSDSHQKCAADHKEFSGVIVKGEANLCSDFCFNFGVSSVFEGACNIACLQEPDTDDVIDCISSGIGPDGAFGYHCPCVDWE